jgi:hypothetical protein
MMMMMTIMLINDDDDGDDDDGDGDDDEFYPVRFLDPKGKVKELFVRAAHWTKQTFSIFWL